VLVDGLLGTGIAGAVRGEAAAAIDAVNAAGARHAVAAADIPSGLNADTGCAEGCAVRADITVTMGYPKRGLLMPAAVEFVGAVRVADIGIPPELGAGSPAGLELVTPEDTPAVWRRRARGAHKGTYGHVLLIGGSPGFAGAIALAARAALRSGAGLVSVLTPEPLAPTVASLVPEAMVHGGAATDAGTLAADCLGRWGRDLTAFDALVLGPGLGLHRQSTSLAERVLAGSRVPLVLDADALSAFANRLFLVKRAACPVILTPHPGEMARLLNCGTDAVQSDRLKAAADAAETATHAVVILKGAGTIVAEAGHAPAVNLTGNPGMAAGGSGDVLAGLLAGLCAQGHTAREAARAGVYLHGRAGDLAARRLSQPALCAGDLIDHLPAAFLEPQPGG
jgi:NAD(P)H-hydrate epimerase